MGLTFWAFKFALNIFVRGPRVLEDMYPFLEFPHWVGLQLSLYPLPRFPLPSLPDEELH